VKRRWAAVAATIKSQYPRQDERAMERGGEQQKPVARRHKCSTSEIQLSITEGPNFDIVKSNNLLLGQEGGRQWMEKRRMKE